MRAVHPHPGAQRGVQRCGMPERLACAHDGGSGWHQLQAACTMPIAQCDDISCKQPGKLDMPALVADLCGSCTKADVSISHPLFANLTGREPGSNPSIVVSWDVVSCSNLTEGTIKMLQKEGGRWGHPTARVAAAAWVAGATPPLQGTRMLPT